jgi:hypothetical protein
LTCPAATPIAIAGGGKNTDPQSAIKESVPVSDSNSIPRGWTIAFMGPAGDPSVQAGTAAKQHVTVYVICAP